MSFQCLGPTTTTEAVQAGLLFSALEISEALISGLVTPFGALLQKTYMCALINIRRGTKHAILIKVKMHSRKKN